MKKLLIAIIIFAGVIFYFLNDKSDVNTPSPEHGTTEINASNATFTFDDGAATLSAGRGEKEDEETGFRESVELLEERAVGDLNADGKNDAVVLLARSGGGSGVFIYIAAYISGPVSHKGTNAIFVGDRISPDSLSISNGVVTFNWLDRNPDEPFAAEPTVPVSEQYIYSDGAFQER